MKALQTPVGEVWNHEAIWCYRDSEMNRFLSHVFILQVLDPHDGVNGKKSQSV